MESASETNSIRSSYVRTPYSKKQVDFARPTLIIPTPQDQRWGQPFANPTPNPNYGRKQSIFIDQLHGIQNFTKSGLGFGEKCALWLYNKLRKWSRKWFTHMFLTIVLLLYTLGGALVFEVIEGQAEAAVEHDLRHARDDLLKELRKTALRTPVEKTLAEWVGEASRNIQIRYERRLENHYTTHKLAVINGVDNKVWTFWNSIVFCGTVYTSIELSRLKKCIGNQPYTLEIMDTSPAVPENPSELNEPKTEENEIDMAKIEAMVTPEQVHSASIAKKRRTYTKRKSANRRDQTPVKEIEDKTTTTDEDVPEPRPKTPERRRRKRTVCKQDGSKSEPETVENLSVETTETEEKSREIRKSSSFSKPKDDFKKRESFGELAHAEVINLLNKTKKGISAAATRGREKLKKFDKEQVKRSQSAPYAFTEEELIESFRKAQLLDNSGVQEEQVLVSELVPEPPKSRKASDSSLTGKTPQKTLRPEVQEFVRQRKKQRSTTSTKIVEILDPKTSNVIATKTIVKPDFRFKQLFSVIRIFTIKELLINFRIFKQDMKDECRRIRILRNRCICELFLIMVFCGLGGFIFKFVEGSFEYFYKCGVKRVKRDFIDLLWFKSHNLREEDWKSLARNRLRIFEEELHVAHEAGMKTYSGQRSWSFLNSIVYCLSIVTTIGYGHIYPETKTGKALTIVYAIIGIPLFLLALTDFGKLFTRCIKFFWSFVRRLYYTGSCRRVRKTAHVKELVKGAQIMYEIATFRRPSVFTDAENPETPSPVDSPVTPAISNFEIDDEFNLPISLAIFILLVYILCGGLIYCLWEGWPFFDSFYFVFISMSTVGFGDMVPNNAAVMIVSIVYLVFGLALMSMCINVVQDKLSNTFKHASTKIGATIGLNVTDDDGSITTVPPDRVDVPSVHDARSLASVKSEESGKEKES